MAAPTVVSASSNNAASGTSLVLTAPTSITDGNVLLMVLSTNNTIITSPTAPLDNTSSPWIQVATSFSGGAWIKRATSVEPASYTVTWSTSAQSVGIIVNISGTSKGLYDVVSTMQSNGTSTNFTAPTVTPKWYNDLLVNIYAISTANAITVPGGQSNIGSSVGNSRAIICGYETLTSNSATGTRVATGTSSGSMGFSIAFREPANIGTLALPLTSYSKGTEYAVSSFGNGPSVLDLGSSANYGTGAISGNCYDINGTPLKMVVVLEKESGFNSRNQLEGVTTLVADGAFSFTRLVAGTYTIWDYDPNGIQTSVLKTVTVTAGNTTSVTLQPTGGGTPLSFKPLYMNTNGHVREAPGTIYLFNKYTTTIGNGASTSFTVTHGLGSQDVMVVVRRTASPYDIVECYAQATNTNEVLLSFASAPSASEYTVTILG